jgi:cytochrome c oxidase cbb3-type subunit 3/ubiquinol-cytochrome c reductase cytochrome c subunit
MNSVSSLCMGLFASVSLGCLGCADAPGRSASDSAVPRPEQVAGFDTLYKENCSGCHGQNGKNGPALPLANPVYLAIVSGATLHQVIAKGVAGTLMPAFQRSAGGTLTGQQIDELVAGILKVWSHPGATGTATTPAYSSGSKGDATQGQKAFAIFCARCHGVDGKGAKVQPGNPDFVPGSIVDPSYLSLVSNQSLRSSIIAGWPGQHMPDWRSDLPEPGARAMTDQEITDVVAWLAAQRTAYPGQPYGPQR